MLPHVTCIMLTADRQAMTSRAIRCFEKQTYEDKSLLILDTGTVRYKLPAGPHPSVSIIHAERHPTETLGALRNWIIGNSAGDVIANFDSDDWSYPGRLVEQVNAMLVQPVECVGYHDAMFFETDGGRAYHWKSNLAPNAVLGGSIMFWRKAWERVKFPSKNTGEDGEWMKEVRTHAIDSLHPSPRMIVTQHGGNTKRIDFDYQCEHAKDAWRRAPEWDLYCERTLRES